MMKNFIRENPFTDEFVKGEIAFMAYDMPETGQIDWRGITMRFKQVQGRCDDYLNKNCRMDTWKTPIMFIDAELWMSLTAMEIQSAFFGWWPMSGKVAMLGLGTGYTSLKCANNPDVEQVVVYERDERMIDLFRHLHGDREECKKIEFVVGDARKTLKGQQFDSVFADIYQTLLGDEVISDIELFLSNNDIGWYRFWGQELVQLWGISEGMISVHDINMIDADYLRHWQSTEESGMAKSCADTGFTRKVLTKMGEYSDIMGVEYCDDGYDYWEEEEYA